MKVYIAGPMTGYHRYNFPAFDRVHHDLERCGYEVVSPAMLDRLSGVDPATFPDDYDWDARLPPETMREIASRDFGELIDCDAIYMLDGWENSRGATTEKMIAEFVGMEVMYQSPPRSNESILFEAHDLVHGDRQEDYGHPYEDFSRTAAMWSALLGTDVSAVQVAMCMVAVKLSRECNRPKRDNVVDAAGYLETLHLVKERINELS